MMRAFLGYVCSWLAFELATWAQRLLHPPGQAGHTSTVGVSARGGSAAVRTAQEVPERYVAELVHIELVRADALLSFMLSNAPCFYYAGTFAKMPDLRWRQ